MELLRICREKNPGWSNPKSLSVCVCVAFLMFLVGTWNLKHPFLMDVWLNNHFSSQGLKNHSTEASIDINGCLRFQVVILGRQPKNMTLSFRKKNNGMSTRVDKSTLSSDFWTVQKVVFSQQKKIGNGQSTRVHYPIFMNL